MVYAHSRRWAVLATVMAGLLLITLDNSILFTALPTLSRDLNTSASENLWIINAYPLVMAGLLLGAGTLGDRIGHRSMFLSGLVIFGAASLIAAYAPTPAILIFARALLAVGAAAMMPATLALVRISFTDERERNFAMALWGSVSVVGFALGPVVSGLLLTHFWWGSVFLINVPVVLVAFVSALVVTPRTEPDTASRWDLLSSVQAMVMLAALVFAIKEAAYAPNSRSWIIALAVGAVAAFLFVRRQSRIPVPLLDFGLFRNPAFSSGVLAAAFALFAFSGLQLLTTQRFQLVADFTPMQAGLLVCIMALGSLPTMLLGGAFLHRIGLRILIAGGMAAAALAVVLVVPAYGLAWTVAGLALAGAGAGATMSVASTAIVTNAPVERAGMAGSVEEVSFELGSLLSVAILGSLVGALYSINLILPTGVSDTARDGITSALAIARSAGAEGEALRTAAATAFDQAFVTVMYIIAATLACGAVLTGVLLRRYGPGSQSSLYPH